MNDKVLSLDLDNPNRPTQQQDGPVECLGKTFKNDQARREYYLAILAEKLKDPEFRKIEGFPIGEDEDILNLSDPPYSTACPNPFLLDFIEHYGRAYSSEETYKREPYAADVSEGRNQPIYNAHSYHTKVPHKAIMRYILNFTKPGDIVLDSFGGSGMLGVAAQLCGSESEVSSLGYSIKNGEVFDSNSNQLISSLGARRSIINDLSPVANFISNNFNRPFDNNKLQLEVDEIFKLAEEELGWVYSTTHENSDLSVQAYELLQSNKYKEAAALAEGKVNYVLWSDIFICPECGEKNIFWDAGVDFENSLVKDKFECLSCSALVEKSKAEKYSESYFDEKLDTSITQAQMVPVLIGYTFRGKKYEKKPDEYDHLLVKKISELKISSWYPADRMPLGKEGRRNDSSGYTHVHHFYTRRNLAYLAFCFEKAKSLRFKFILTSLMFKSSILCAPLMSNYFAEKKGQARGGWIGKERTGTLYNPSIHSEVPVSAQLKTRRNSTAIALDCYGDIAISTGSATKLMLPSNSIDYVFIDPPFGSNIYYSELSYIWESWLKVKTAIQKEAIENSTQKKGPNEYRLLMVECFKEVYRVLKPGRWVTVEFSNTKSYIWNNIQSSLTEAGFIISNVSALSKKQGSINAYTTSTAVKQDLVISAYKPNGGFEDRFVNESNEEGVWDFIRTHLGYLPIIKCEGTELSKIPERDPRILFDQVVAYFVRNMRDVPLSSREFQNGLQERFSERDGMVFLPEQVVQYDKARITSTQLRQLSIFVDDEASAIEWLRQLLNDKPQTYQDIHPKFINELSGWKKAEIQLELMKLLEQNFLKFNGQGLVPAQIHSYLSTNFKELRGLEKDDSQLLAKAKDRWFVPDPNNEEQLQALRERDLLKQFEEYKSFSGKKIKLVRLEAVRAGFKKAWQDRDYATIIHVAEKIPDDLLQEDQKLLMWYDQAQTRHSDSSLF
ncbi:DNA methyltransferase [Acinetobacter baumannii]|nr:DNA methyltransferase [Acinetobacter baumannii]